MGDRETARPETTWGAIRALIQAVTGVAFALEDEPTIALALVLVAAATAVYEAAAWWHWHRRPGRAPRSADRAGRVDGATSRPARDGPGPKAAVDAGVPEGRAPRVRGRAGPHDGRARRSGISRPT